VVPVPILLGGGGLLGKLDGIVLVGAALPGRQGFATVAEIPPGREAAVDPTPVLVVLEMLPVVGGVLLDAVVVELPVEIPVPVFDGVHGVTVLGVLVPVFCVPPVTDPALPATPGVPGVTDGLPAELAPGVVGVVPCCAVGIVPGGRGVCDCVPGVPVCVPIPWLGETVPVVCAVARPTDNANTVDANKILRIESCSL
jgi:hypothetical protein